MLLTHFQILRPPFEQLQAETLEWIVEAHTKAESMKGISGDELATFRTALKEKLWHVGCKPDRIEKRGHILNDYLHLDWNKMGIYRLNEEPTGKNASFRNKVFEEYVDGVFDSFYPEDASSPDDLIHVSCTGYVSPSGAQKIVSKRNWGKQTTVTHAYHMGCYGSFPAIRMARGFLCFENKKQVDIVHTEICSLHINPSLHATDQLVTQSLFADGFIKYSVVPTTSSPHFKILAVLEEIIPHSTQAMTWNVVDWGHQMTLAKEVPVLIRRHLLEYLKRLCQKTQLPEDILKQALFAIHPGGPKILFQIQELFQLSDFQLTYSFEILKNYGNMSSATLPHIWQAVLNDANIPSGSLIISLAFGPGLSISGSIMEKQCGS